MRRPNWKLECSLMAGKPVHSSGASTLVSSSFTTGRRDTWIQFSHSCYQRKVIVHPDGWFEEGGLGGIREDGDKSTTGDRQQARVRTLLSVNLVKHRGTDLNLRCCTRWQPGVAHLQFCITERSHFDSIALESLSGLNLVPRRPNHFSSHFSPLWASLSCAGVKCFQQDKKHKKTDQLCKILLSRPKLLIVAGGLLPLDKFQFIDSGRLGANLYFHMPICVKDWFSPDGVVIPDSHTDTLSSRLLHLSRSRSNK